MTWPTEADVEAAARATFRVFWPSSYWPSLAKPDQERYLEGARAALAAIPDPRAAPNRLADVNASGIIDEVCGEWAIETPQGFATALWSRLLDAIAALKPEDKP